MVKESAGDREAREVTIKKRRKTTTTPAASTLAMPKIPDADVYKNVMEYEEEEASLRDPENDVLLFKNTCDEIRKAMYEIAELKKKNTEQAQAEIAEKRTATSLLFVFLKKLNRLEKFRTKKSRDLLNKEKQQVDSYHLQLQNLLYEKLHLKKEVTKCLEFKSKDEEIDLVPVEEFFREAPEHVSRPEVSKSDPHQLKLARLEWELLQRKQLADQCQQLQEAKEKVAAEIQSKRERMENITPRLNNILEVTQPLQDYLGLPLDKVRKQHQVAYLLPRPLYILYVQADAYREACDKQMTVVVGGDEEEAVRLQHSMAGGAQDLENNDDSESDPELEAPEDLGDRQKRHSRKMSRQDRLEERKKRLLLSHPLYVEIQIKLPDNNHVMISFHYLINLRVVTVKPVVGFLQGFHGISANDLIASQNILSELFPGDDGSESPNTANHYQLSNVGLDHFKAYVPLLGIPYMWAQKLAGLDFMASRPDTGVSQGAVGNEEVASPEVSRASMESVVKAIRHRLKARLALCRQVQAFEAGGIPVLPALRSMFATKFGAELASWHIATWDDYKVASTTQRLVQAGAVTRADNLYRAVINRGTARLIALVAVKPDYPRSPAVFSLNLHWNGEHNSSNDDAIRDMEAEVNVHWRELAKGRGWGWGLLAAQFLRLISCLDIHLEASAPNEFPRDKVFFKPVRGRNRARPYKYLPIGGGIFSQR